MDQDFLCNHKEGNKNSIRQNLGFFFKLKIRKARFLSFSNSIHGTLFALLHISFFLSSLAKRHLNPE